MVPARSEALARILQALQSGIEEPKLQKTIADTLQAAGKHSTITLIYAAKDIEHNEAVVLQAIFKRRAG
jgi:uncharacterized protein YeaO (DUF488 family)